MSFFPWIAMVLVALAGGATAMQAPMNARLAGGINGPINAAFVSFAVGTMALGIMAAIAHARPDVTAARALPAYAWTGGLCGVIFVVTAAWSVPRLGVATTITLMVAGQLLVGLALDHFGAFGAPQSPISLTKIAGVVLVFLGVLLVRKV